MIAEFVMFLSPLLLTTQVDYPDPNHVESAVESAAGNRKDLEVPFEELVELQANYVVHGKVEDGKTTLLKQLALALLQRQSSLPRPTLPLIINFREITRGRERLQRLLRAALAEDLPNVTMGQLLSAGLVTILLDDVAFEDVGRYPIIRDFITNFPKCRYIFTTAHAEASRFAAVVDPQLPIALQPLFMKPMTRGAMRRLVGKWDVANRFNHEELLNKLVTEIVRINVPLTAVNGTILLSIYENQVNFRAINRAVLVENFVEALLERARQSPSERRTFDFTN